MLMNVKSGWPRLLSLLILHSSVASPCHICFLISKIFLKFFVHNCTYLASISLVKKKIYNPLLSLLTAIC